MASPEDPDAKPLYTRQRKGRWYLEPPLRLRRSHGLEIKPLSSDQTNAWAYARKLNKELAGLDPNAPAPGSVAWLFEQFFESDRFKALARSTQSDYRWLAERLGRVELAGQQLGCFSARAIKPSHADKLYALLRQQSGAAVAHYVCRVARRVWKWGDRREFVGRSPKSVVRHRADFAADW